MKRIVLCADDYGQAPAISEGICHLVRERRLSAVSCMVNTPCWAEQAPALLPYREHIDMGLHFNLSEGRPLSEDFIRTYGGQFPSLMTLIRKAHLSDLDKKVIVAELNAQLDAFANATGFLPDFVDGHQHIHQFPVIRDALLAVYQDRLKNNQSYIRLVALRLSLGEIFSKKLIIYLTGVRALKRLLSDHGIPHNETFSGIYDFEDAADYARKFPGFLREVGDGGLIMCHPGLAQRDEPDAIVAARICEYNYLISAQFKQDMLENNVKIQRFAEIGRPLSL